MYMSGPLPSPQAVERAAAVSKQQQQMRTPSQKYSAAGPGPTFRNSQSLRYYSGPLDPSAGLYGSQGAGSIGHNSHALRPEPLHKSGPIGKSPLGGLLSPTDSPPRVAELHKLPPPPLNSTAPASFATPPPPIPQMAAPTGGPRLRGPPGLLPLPLPPSRCTWLFSACSTAREGPSRSVCRQLEVPNCSNHTVGGKRGGGVTKKQQLSWVTCKWPLDTKHLPRYFRCHPVPSNLILPVWLD